MELNYIWLNGMPRSGTSWLSQIFDSHPNVRFKLSPLFSYAFKDAVNGGSNRDEWLQFLQRVYFTEDDFMDQKHRRKNGEYPVFENKERHPSHLVIKDTRYHNLTKRILTLVPEIKFIHIIRHPCGAINSWIEAPREFPPKANPLREWRSGKCRKTGEEEFWGFEDWKYLTKLYLTLQDKYPDRVMIVRYEELVDEPLHLVGQMFQFANLALHRQTVNFVKDSQSRNVEGEYAVYKQKGVKDKWKQKLNKRIVAQIYADLDGSRLSEFL